VTHEHLEIIPVVAPSPRASVATAAPNRWLFASFIAAGFAVAAVTGMTLALLAGTRVWVGDEHWTATIQAHGRIQAWAFAVVLVSGLAPEFLARFNGRMLPATWLRLTSAGLIAGGTLLGAPAATLPAWLGWLPDLGAAMTVAGSLLFARIILGIRRFRPIRADLHPAFFLAAAAWLVVGSLLLVKAEDGTMNGIFPGAETRAMHEVLLRGFILGVIIGVTIRALPGHAGTRPLLPVQQAAVFVVLQSAVVLWLAGSGAFVDSSAEWATRAGNALTATVLLYYTLATGIFDPRRLQDADRVNLFIRIAWVGALAWAALLLWWAAAPDAVSAHREGAIRHTAMLGFMAPLMLAFAHVVLVRFGNGIIARHSFLTAGFVLVATAWPLRVAAGLLFTPDDSASRVLMGIAGVMVMMGLGGAAVSAGATASALRRASRPDRSESGRQHEARAREGRG